MYEVLAVIEQKILGKMQNQLVSSKLLSILETSLVPRLHYIVCIRKNLKILDYGLVSGLTVDNNRH